MIGRKQLLRTTMVVALLAPSSCRSNHPAAEHFEPLDSAASLPSLRVSADRLTAVELSKAGSAPIRLSKLDGKWKVTAPVNYRANLPAVESIVAAIGELEVTSTAQGGESNLRKHGLDAGSAIEVKAWAGDRLESRFFVGLSTRDQTGLQVPGEPRILIARGRCRPIFAKSLDELRDPTVTDFALEQIESVTYSNSFGKLELAPGTSEARTFLAKGEPVRNFDADHATKDVAVVARLHAKGFLDAPGDPDITGLFAENTAKITLQVRQSGELRRVDVWVGARTSDRRLHVRTSESGQIYLVSGHLESSLLAHRKQFERSDDTMRQLKTLAAQRADAGTGAIHSHQHPSELPTTVPPELLGDLRALAKAQLEP